MFAFRCRLSLLLLVALPAWGQEATTDETPPVRRITPEINRIHALSARELVTQPPVTAHLVTTRETAALNVAPLRGSLQDWKLTDLEGRDVSAQLAPRQEGARLWVSTADAAPFAIKPKEIQTMPVEKGVVMRLPGGIVTPTTRPRPTTDPTDPVPTAPGRDVLDWLRLTFLASPTPAVWNDAEQLYATDITLGLDKSGNGSDAASTLPRPVTVRMSFEGLVGENPPEVSIGGPGLQNEQSFTLRFRPTTERPILRVRSTISDVDLELAALRRLALSASRTELLGFGLGTASITVEELEPHGARVQLDAPLPLSVSVEGSAQVEPAVPVLTVGPATGTFLVRSAGLGPVPVTARIGDLSATILLEQRFPTGPLLAVLLGGALGGFARRFVKRDPGRKPQVGRWILEGLTVGVVAFVAGVLGVGYLELPPAIVATEAGAFLTGVLSGFVGIVVLERLAGLLGKQNPPAAEGAP